MAKPFILTAQINLQAPNVNKTIANIRKQLSDVNAKVNVVVPKGSARQLNAINKNIQDIGKSASKAGKDMGKFTGGIRGALTYLVKYDLARTIINGVVDTIRDGTQAAISFEKEMIKVGQVTGKSLQSLQGLQKEIGRLSTSLGVSSSSLVKTSRILAQTGISAKDVKIALDALAKSTLAATFDDITSTTETAIAAMSQFGFASGKLEQELSRINALAANFAVEAGDIGTAIKRTGGAFMAAGGQLVELEALFTSVRSTTRETAETIATGFRTIFTRIQRPKTIQFLRQVGIELQDLSGNFVGPFEAVRRLNLALKDLDPRDVRYSQIVEQLGGFRQVSKVIPLIQQFATAQKALTVAQAGGSSLAKDAAKAQLGLGNQIAKVKEEFQELFRTLVGSTGFQNMIKLALTLAKAMVKVVESITPLVPLLATLAVGKGVGFLATGMGRGRGKNQGGRIHNFASGGSVPGTGNRDTVPAMLTPGEFVIKKSSVKSIGRERLGQMNKYAKGGIAKFPSGFAKDNSVNRKLDTKKGSGTSFKEGTHAFTAGPKKEDSVNAKIIPNKIDLVKVLKSKGIISGAKGQEQIRGGRGKSTRKGNTSTFKDTIRSFLGSAGITKGNAFEDILYDSGYVSRAKDGKADFGHSSPLDGKRGNNLVEIGISKRSETKILDKRFRHENKKDNFKGETLTSSANTLDLTPVEEITNSTNEILLKEILEGPKTKSSTGKKLTPSRRARGNVANIRGPASPRVRRARGGGISGTDTVPAMLTPGEFVINRQSASKIGYGNLNNANRFGKTPQGFAAGGRVPSSGKSHFGIQSTSSGSGGGGGGDKAFKALLLLDLILPQLANKFKVVDGETSKAGAAISGLSSALLTMTTVALLVGPALGQLLLNAGVGKGAQTAGAFAVTLIVAAGFAVKEFGEQLKKAAISKLEDGGFKTERETAEARNDFGRGERLSRQGDFAAKGAIGGGLVGAFTTGVAGAKIGAAFGTAIAGPIGTAVGGTIGFAAGAGVGAGVGAGIGAGVGNATFDENKALSDFASKLRTLKLGASLEDLDKSLKLFTEGKASPRQIAGVVTSAVTELEKGLAQISTDEELVDFNAGVSKAIPGIAAYVQKVAASSDSFEQLQQVVGVDTLNAFSQLSGVSLERMRKEIESGVIVRKKALVAQKAQLAAIKATNKVLRQARNVISGFASVAQTLTQFDAALDNVGQSISNSFGPASITKIAPQFADISNIFNFDKFNQQVDNVATVMGSAGSSLGSNIKQFAKLSSILPNILTEAAGEIGLGGARASEIIEKKILAADPGGIIGEEFRRAIVRRVTAVADLGEGGEGKFAGRIRQDIDGVVRDLTKGMAETQRAFEQAGKFIDSANARLARAYDLRTKLELDIANKMVTILELQRENTARLRKARGKEPDGFAAEAGFNSQQNTLLGGTNASGMGSRVDVVGREFIRLKIRIAESNQALSTFGVDATAGVSDLTDSQRALLDENAKLKEEFARTKDVLNNYANVQKRIGAIQEKIAKEAAKRNQLLSGASEYAFATDQRRAEISQAMFAAQVAARRGIEAIPSDLRGAVKGVFEQFSDVRLFNGKTGKEAKAEIDIRSLEQFYGPLTEAQKKRITEATTQEERFINDLRSIQNEAVVAQKFLLAGMGADRKNLAKTIGNLHRELISGIKDIFLKQQERTLGRELSETKGSVKAAEGQLNILRGIQRLGIPVQDPRVLEAVRNNIQTVKTLKEARIKKNQLEKVSRNTNIIDANQFKTVSKDGDSAARESNFRAVFSLTQGLQRRFGVDLGNKVSQVLKDRLRSLMMNAQRDGKDLTPQQIAQALRESMAEFGLNESEKQNQIITANEDILKQAGLGLFVTKLTNNIDFISDALLKLPDGATWESLTSNIVTATTGIKNLNIQLANIKQDVAANEAAGNAAAAQGGGGAGPVRNNAAGGPVRLAEGGFSPHGTDTVPAMLTPGEFVVNKAATKRNSGALQAINSGKTQYLAGGGEVEKWFSGKANKVVAKGDPRFAYKKSEESAIESLKNYVKLTFDSVAKDDSFKFEYDRANNAANDFGPGHDFSTWGPTVKVPIAAHRFSKKKEGDNLAQPPIERWKPRGDIVKFIPATNEAIGRGGDYSGDLPFANNIVSAANVYKYLVDKNFKSVKDSDGLNTNPGWDEPYKNHFDMFELAGPVRNNAAAASLESQFINYAKQTRSGGAINVTGGSPFTGSEFIDNWDITDTPGFFSFRPTVKHEGRKWNAEESKTWFEGENGSNTIKYEAANIKGSYVPIERLVVPDVALGAESLSTDAKNHLSSMGASWENQAYGVSSTYGKLAEKRLTAAKPFMRKFFEDGDNANYQRDFLQGILSGFHPLRSEWKDYAQEGQAYRHVGNPNANLKGISNRFMKEYNKDTYQGSATVDRAELSYLDIDPTRLESMKPSVIGEFDNYTNLYKSRQNALGELSGFFDTQPQNVDNPTAAAAKVMDDFQVLIGTGVTGIGSNDLANVQLDQQQAINNNAGRRQALLDDVAALRRPGGPINTPFDKESKIVALLKGRSAQLKDFRNNARVPNYAKRNNAKLRGTRELKNVDWEIKDFKDTFPFLNTLADDINLLTSSGLVESIDGEGVGFNGTRVLETLSRSFDQILDGAGNDSAVTLNQVVGGNIRQNRFKGGRTVNGDSLFDRMKMWAYSPAPTWYGGVQDQESNTTGVMFEGGIVGRHLNLLKGQAKEVLETSIKEYDKERERKRIERLGLATGGVVPQFFATGGSIFSPQGTDTVPAMLTPGEFVVNKSSAQANMPLLQSINNGETQYLSHGGFAGKPTYLKTKYGIKSGPHGVQGDIEGYEKQSNYRMAGYRSPSFIPGDEGEKTIAPTALSPQDSNVPRQETDTSISGAPEASKFTAEQAREIERAKSQGVDITGGTGSPTRKTDLLTNIAASGVQQQKQGESTVRTELEAAGTKVPKATTTSTSTGKQDTSIALTKTEQQELERAKNEAMLEEIARQEEVQFRQSFEAGSVPRTDTAKPALPSSTGATSPGGENRSETVNALLSMAQERAAKGKPTEGFSAQSMMDKGTQSTTTDWWHRLEAQMGRKLTDQEKRDITQERATNAGNDIEEVGTGLLKFIESPFIGAMQLGRAIGASVIAGAYTGSTDEKATSEEAIMRWKAFGDQLYNLGTVGGVLHDHYDDFRAVQKGTSDTGEHKNRKKHVFEPQTLDKYYGTLKKNKETWMGIGSYSDPLDEAGWWFDQMPELIELPLGLLKGGSNLVRKALKKTGSSFDETATAGFRLNPEQTGKLFNDVLPAPTLRESLAAGRAAANTSAILNSSRVAQETSKYGGDVVKRTNIKLIKPIDSKVSPAETKPLTEMVKDLKVEEVATNTKGVTRPTLKPTDSPALGSQVKKSQERIAGTVEDVKVKKVEQVVTAQDIKPVDSDAILKPAETPSLENIVKDLKVEEVVTTKGPTTRKAPELYQKTLDEAITYRPDDISATEYVRSLEQKELEKLGKYSEDLRKAKAGSQAAKEADQAIEDARDRLAILGDKRASLEKAKNAKPTDTAALEEITSDDIDALDQSDSLANALDDLKTRQAGEATADITAKAETDAKLAEAVKKVKPIDQTTVSKPVASNNDFQLKTGGVLSDARVALYDEMIENGISGAEGVKNWAGMTDANVIQTRKRFGPPPTEELPQPLRTQAEYENSVKLAQEQAANAPGSPVLNPETASNLKRSNLIEGGLKDTSQLQADLYNEMTKKGYKLEEAELLKNRLLSNEQIKVYRNKNSQEGGLLNYKAYLDSPKSKAEIKATEKLIAEQDAKELAAGKLDAEVEAKRKEAQAAEAKRLKIAAEKKTEIELQNLKEGDIKFVEPDKTTKIPALIKDGKYKEVLSIDPNNKVALNMREEAIARIKEAKKTAEEVKVADEAGKTPEEFVDEYGPEIDIETEAEGGAFLRESDSIATEAPAINAAVEKSRAESGLKPKQQNSFWEMMRDYFNPKPKRAAQAKKAKNRMQRRRFAEDAEGGFDQLTQAANQRSIRGLEAPVGTRMQGTSNRWSGIDPVPEGGFTRDQIDLKLKEMHKDFNDLIGTNTKLPYGEMIPKGENIVKKYGPYIEAERLRLKKGLETGTPVTETSLVSSSPEVNTLVRQSIGSENFNAAINKALRRKPDTKKLLSFADDAGSTGFTFQGSDLQNFILGTEGRSLTRKSEIIKALNETRRSATNSQKFKDNFGDRFKILYNDVYGKTAKKNLEGAKDINGVAQKAGQFDLWKDDVPENIKELLGEASFKNLMGFASGGTVPRFAAGGQLPTRGTDTVPAMLTPGEFVMKKSAVDKHGVGFMQSINNGTQYLENGGDVNKRPSRFNVIEDISDDTPNQYDPSMYLDSKPESAKPAWIDEPDSKRSAQMRNKEWYDAGAGLRERTANWTSWEDRLLAKDDPASQVLGNIFSVGNRALETLGSAGSVGVNLLMAARDEEYAKWFALTGNNSGQFDYDTWHEQSSLRLNNAGSHLMNALSGGKAARQGLFGFDENRQTEYDKRLPEVFGEEYAALSRWGDFFAESGIDVLSAKFLPTLLDGLKGTPKGPKVPLGPKLHQNTVGDTMENLIQPKRIPDPNVARTMQIEDQSKFSQAHSDRVRTRRPALEDGRGLIDRRGLPHKSPQHQPFDETLMRDFTALGKSQSRAGINSRTGLPYSPDDFLLTGDEALGVKIDMSKNIHPPTAPGDITRLHRGSNALQPGQKPFEGATGFVTQYPEKGLNYPLGINEHPATDILQSIDVPTELAHQFSTSNVVPNLDLVKQYQLSGGKRYTQETFDIMDLPVNRASVEKLNILVESWGSGKGTIANMPMYEGMIPANKAAEFGTNIKVVKQSDLLSKPLATGVKPTREVVENQKKLNKQFGGGNFSGKFGSDTMQYAAGGTVPGFAAGGQLPTRGTDTVPAMLTPGEFVMKKSAVDKHGVGFMQSINDGTQYFKEGGIAQKWREKREKRRAGRKGTEEPGTMGPEYSDSLGQKPKTGGGMDLSFGTPPTVAQKAADDKTAANAATDNKAATDKATADKAAAEAAAVRKAAIIDNSPNLQDLLDLKGEYSTDIPDAGAAKNILANATAKEIEDLTFKQQKVMDQRNYIQFLSSLAKFPKDSYREKIREDILTTKDNTLLGTLGKGSLYGLTKEEMSGLDLGQMAHMAKQKHHLNIANKNRDYFIKLLLQKGQKQKQEQAKDNFNNKNPEAQEAAIKASGSKGAAQAGLGATRILDYDDDPRFTESFLETHGGSSINEMPTVDVGKYIKAQAFATYRNLAVHIPHDRLMGQLLLGHPVKKYSQDTMDPIKAKSLFTDTADVNKFFPAGTSQGGTEYWKTAYRKVDPRNMFLGETNKPTDGLVNEASAWLNYIKTVKTSGYGYDRSIRTEAESNDEFDVRVAKARKEQVASISYYKSGNPPAMAYREYLSGGTDVWKRPPGADPDPFKEKRPEDDDEAIAAGWVKTRIADSVEGYMDTKGRTGLSKLLSQVNLLPSSMTRSFLDKENAAKDAAPKSIAYRAAGGSIFSPKGTDTVPAMLTPGEFVIRKSAVDAVGVNALQNINSMGSGSRARNGSYFYTGGSVGAGASGSNGPARDFLSGALKNATTAITKMISAFKGREESKAQGAPTSYTLNSDNFTKAVGAFDESVNRLDIIMSRGITMLHEHVPMAINMTVDGNVAATTDGDELASTIRAAVAEGINHWALTNGMTDFSQAD